MSANSTAINGPLLAETETSTNDAVRHGLAYDDPALRQNLRRRVTYLFGELGFDSTGELHEENLRFAARFVTRSRWDL